MNHATSAGEPLADDIFDARKEAILKALVSEALSDEAYCEALFLAAFNVLGFRSVTHSVPLAGLLGIAQSIAARARENAKRQMLQ